MFQQRLSAGSGLCHQASRGVGTRHARVRAPRGSIRREEGQLRGGRECGFLLSSIEDAAAVKRWRDGALVRDDGIEIGLGGIAPLDGADEAVETGEAFQLFGAAEF